MTGFLALDQSKSSTGWAAWETGWERPVWGHVCLGTSFTEDRKVFTKLRKEIIDKFTVVTQFDFLFYEEVIAAKKHVKNSEEQRLMLVGLRAIIENVGDELRCRSVEEVKDDEWRETFLGRDAKQEIKRAARRAEHSARGPLKGAVMEQARYYGFRVRNDDESDAIGILTHGILSKGFTPPWLLEETLRAPLMGVAK